MANELEFWQNRWETGKTGWHKQEINQYLKKYYQKCEKGLTSSLLSLIEFIKFVKLKLN